MKIYTKVDIKTRKREIKMMQTLEMLHSKEGERGRNSQGPRGFGHHSSCDSHLMKQGVT